MKNTRRELIKVIKEVDREIQTTFASAYADVSENFARIFNSLFPGGQGKLILTTPNDILNTGIEIEARPPGKNVKKLSLLSGGERSLTALAFLFAVFKSRPSPFYVMDEAEAALDDVNLHRFLALVNEFRKDAQLLIVSHQKRTMEAGDCLLGVTMQPAVGSVLGRSGVDQSTWDDLEEALLRADVGVKVSTALLDDLRGRVKAKELTTPHEVIGALRSTMKSRLAGASRDLTFDSSLEGPNIWLMVGVNGAGKTTSLGKIAAQQVAAGRRVVMAAGDTFRAAAGEQLATWAERSGAEIVRGAEGGDPSSVIFDAVQSAGARGADLVLADTAGRLQSNTNLMEELRKVRRVAEKGTGRVTEVLLVIDATTGQNGLVQAPQFAEATQVTGVVLTKLDGSAKGGI
ncbi:MAG: signal recognition particle-docking protein FtsY, partial [Actinobacteria bacterium]|nr:signal recognition particle-docking protein FtsY [Actinomycetota bacterium]